jgi:hypothetical protein
VPSIELPDEQYARLVQAAAARGLSPVGWILATVLDSDTERRESGGAGFLPDDDRAYLTERLEQERREPAPEVPKVAPD